MPNHLIHQYLLGYASTGALYHLHPGVSLMTPRFKVATIDHSIWYHRPFKWTTGCFTRLKVQPRITAGLVRGGLIEAIWLPVLSEALCALRLISMQVTKMQDEATWVYSQPSQWRAVVYLSGSIAKVE